MLQGFIFRSGKDTGFFFILLFVIAFHDLQQVVRLPGHLSFRINLQVFFQVAPGSWHIVHEAVVKGHQKITLCQFRIQVADYMFENKVCLLQAAAFAKSASKVIMDLGIGRFDLNGLF